MSDIIPTSPPGALALAGQAANHFASLAAFDNYRERKSPKTLDRQGGDLALFGEYLKEKGLPAGDFARDPEAWRGVSWGLVAGFIRWQLAEGYAVGSINVRLSTVKTYAALASQAGVLAPEEYALIQTVKGYRRSEGKHVDELRESEGLNTRRRLRRNTTTSEGGPVRAGKKAEAVSLTKEQAHRLKTQPDTPQGRRDSLIMCLLLDHGLRVGELQRLTVDNFDLKAGELRFYRPKVDKVQTHRLSKDTLRAARAYLANDAPALACVWRASASKRDGKAMAGELTQAGMSIRALTGRVAALGESIGIPGLTAHDCRHFWATQLARKGTPLDRLKDAGGWSSYAMPLRYIEAAKIANEGAEL